MRLQTEKGEIQISGEVFTTITGAVATGCFGVKGMAASMRYSVAGLHMGKSLPNMTRSGP